MEHYPYDDIRKRVFEYAGLKLPSQFNITTDTSNFTTILRNNILCLEGEYFLVRGNMYESRFSLEDFPKYWVKSGIELNTGKRVILKWEFNENFIFHIGALNIKCYRSSQKEIDILKLVNHNPHFMHGRTLVDAVGTPVKIINFIKGRTFYQIINSLEIPHEQYFSDYLPGVLVELRKCIKAIEFIHEHDYYHGDIRNDHIIIDDSTKTWRWIDFDLNQDFADFDIWSLGNILLYATGNGEHTRPNIEKNNDISQQLKNKILAEDMSAFFKHRVMNLKKIFPYIPDKLNRILMSFSISTTVFYETITDIILDLDEVIDELGGSHGPINF